MRQAAKRGLTSSLVYPRFADTPDIEFRSNGRAKVRAMVPAGEDQVLSSQSLYVRFQKPLDQPSLEDYP